MKVFSFIQSNISLASFVVLSIALPVSEFGMSVSLFGLAIGWLINGPKKKQFNALLNEKVALFVIGIFLLDIIGLIHTSNTQYAMGLLRIKLPLLLVPLFASALNYSSKKWMILVGFFSASTLTATFILFLNYHLNLKGTLTDLRDISIYISHIRFSLMINIAILALGVFILRTNFTWRFWLFIPIIWFIYFLVFLGSGTGYLVFVYILLAITGYVFGSIKSRKVVLAFLAGISGVLIYLSTIAFTAYDSYFTLKDHPYNIQDTNRPYNERGHALQSAPQNMQMQNGFLVWRNVCYSELHAAWKAVADEKYQKMNLKNQPAVASLIVYLTSKGLPKDSIGVYQLSKQDLENIYKGYRDYRMSGWNGLERKIDGYAFQLYALIHGHNPGNKSVNQRVEYVRAAIKIIAANPWFGVGSGDIQDAFKTYYQTHDVKLEEQYQARSHNQFLTYFVALGVFGFLAFLILNIRVLVEFFKADYFLAVSFGILLISFLTEDTLETQPGVTLYAWLIGIGILILSIRKSKVSNQ
jgi:hypothetical protein